MDKIELLLNLPENVQNDMKNTITFNDTSVSLDTGMVQTRTVKEPELVWSRLKLMGIESLKPFQARRMFEYGTCEDKEITLTYDETSVTLDTSVGDFTRIVSNPKFVWSRLRALGVESLPTQKAKRLFDRGSSFYNTREKLSLVLTEGQTVRHVIKESIWEAVYQGGVLVWNKRMYASLHAFVSGHYRAVHPTRTSGNAWQICETNVDGKWVNLRDHYFYG